MMEMTTHRLLLAFAFCLSAAAGVEWPVATPASQGFDPARLEKFRQDVAARNTKALLVARHGKLVLEWYAEGVGADMKQGTASLAKALVGGMPLLVTLQDGCVQVDDLACKFIPRWKSDPRKSRITIRQLATHTSGIEDAEDNDLPHDQLTGWKGAFWKRKPDPISIALDQAPVIFPPGSRAEYSNPGMAALAYAVTAALRGAPQTDIKELLAKRICGPIGIPETDWLISYGESYEMDGLRVYANWGGGSFTPRAAARIGQLMLQKGEWNGRQLLRREWVEKVTADAGMPNDGTASGLCWWLNVNGRWGKLPRDAFGGAGGNQQVLLVVPSLSLVMVRNGRYLSAAGEKHFWEDIIEYLFSPMMDMLNKETTTSSPRSSLQPVAAPYPDSPAVKRISFDPPAAIIRKAIGSDNWPITWGDDDDLYTAYGDGWGFEPLLDTKLSLGLARIKGGPPTFTAFNIRSATAERTGNGKNGAKTSGMLMVDGVLYMWVRNVGNSQLVWSANHGRTWEWGFKLENGFGAPAFLNFGRNYAGARDKYVYSYSQDGPSAYESYDGVALARVPRDRIRERDAYEFFVRLEEGQPVWARDIAQRGAVFSFPGHCQRVDAVYHPVLKRYLLAVGYDHNSGWGVYDAPEPWGPWTTAFHIPQWDVAGTHGYRLPSKWISSDGRSMYLVFSGVKQYDAFCVRRMYVETAP
jgi:CubicO group peptidase (beta-lactamase class C family)